MTKYFVTGHKGAREWHDRRSIGAELLGHLDPSIIRPGDIVYGSLPFQVVADVIARGGRYFHLVMDLKEEDRRKEHSADDMDNKLRARLVEYDVRLVSNENQQ